MATESAEFAFEGPAGFEEVAERERVAGLGPWRLALRRLRRNREALAFGALFLVIVLLCLAAPLWAERRGAHRPLKNHLTDRSRWTARTKDVVAPDGVPIGPTYQGEFFLGADGNGRDIAVRLLYGGRNSLLIGAGAALHHHAARGDRRHAGRATSAAGRTRSSRAILDVIWAYPGDPARSGARHGA